ncbi:hypothetical protein CEK60_05805 [Halomonas sp. N3-2A]|nr:hypothetical protein CEK60_05805 [Halomonas sp. N3-2A]
MLKVTHTHLFDWLGMQNTYDSDQPSAGSKLPLLPLDLHVLGLPPAFNLSHDQTLQFKIIVMLTRHPKT